MDPSPLTQHLGTNYVPSDEEVSTIQQLLHDYTGAAKALEEGIDCEGLEKVLSMKKERLTEFKKAIDEHKALLSPLRRLPAEILLTIFGKCIPRLMAISNKHPAVVLSHVCRDWRGYVLAQKALWSSIFVRIPVSDPASAGHAQKSWRLNIDKLIVLFGVWITRSAYSPLILQVDIPMCANMGCRAAQGYILNLLHVICQTSARWKEFTLNVCVNNCTRPFTVLLELLAEDVPILEIVDVGIFGLDNVISRRDLEQILSNSGIFATPSLRRLTLYTGWGCLHPTVMAKAWRALEHLALYAAPCSVRTPTLDSTALLHYLTHIPNLRSVEFALDARRPLTLQPIPVSMKNLTKVVFYIRNYPFPRVITEYLSLPALHTLEIHLCHGDGVGGDDELVRFFSQTGERIRVLLLSMDKFSSPLLSAIVSQVPHLEDLTTNLKDDAQEINEFSTRPDCRTLHVLNAGVESVPCPNLKRFQMTVRHKYTDGSIEEALLAFLVYRFNEAKRHRCARLQVVDVQFPYPRREGVVDVVQELHNLGVDLGCCNIHLYYRV